MNALEILQVEGIVIRKIQTTVVSLFSEKAFRSKPNQVLFFNEAWKRNMVRETNTNSLGGKFLVTTDSGQGENIMFKRWGIGNTLEEAYAEYLHIKDMNYDDHKAYRKANPYAQK